MQRYRLREWALVLMTASSVWSAKAATFDDIQFWTGSGTNRAAVVIDWKDGKNPGALLWGYRWNGAATGLDMLKGVVTADKRLFAHLGEFSWGTAIFGIGYDLNNRGDFAVNPPLSFDAGGLVLETGSTNANDARVSSDSANHFEEGWNGAFWAYYLKDSATEDWASAMTGADGRSLSDGAWDGYSFAPGFISRAPSEPAAALANPFAFEVVFAQGPFGDSPYDDPAAVLGMPSTNFYDAFGGMSGGATDRRVKLVEPAYNLDLTQTHKLITTLNEGSSIVVRFEQPIQDDPAHPYGIDFLVFGNSFYTANDFVNDSSDMNSLMLTGAGFYEPMKVSVSPGYTGATGQDPTNSATWAWYRYENGPYADTAFPTQEYKWNRTNSTWSSELMDSTKPVNPVFGPLLDAGGISAADGIDLYDGSGGGTGFDLAQSGFSAIQYVKIEGLTNYAGGEVDAISSVRPMYLGDSLSISPANLTNGTGRLRFQRPNLKAETGLTLDFTNVSEIARVSTAPISDSFGLAAYGRVLGGAVFGVTPLLGSNAVAFQANLKIGVGPGYSGDGKDLVLLHQVQTDWEGVPFAYDSPTGAALVPSATNGAALAVLQVLPPSISLKMGLDAGGHPLTTVKVPVVPGFAYTLERTEDFVHWNEVASVSPLVLQVASLNYGDAAKGAFYRVRMSRGE